MSRKRTTMPKHAPPIEMDLPRIEEAVRRLAALAIREDRKIITPTEAAPADWPATQIGRLIYHPVAEACRASHQTLFTYLASNIGEPAAREIFDRINVEVGARLDTGTAMPEPAQIRH